MGEHIGESHILNKIGAAISTLSFIGSFFIIYSFIRFQKLRKFSLHLVVWLSVSDIGLCIADFMGDPPPASHLCLAQAVFEQFFPLATVSWSSVISYTLYQIIVYQERVGQWKIDFLIHLFAWGVPALFTLIPGITHDYGDTGAWCWIESTNQKEADRGTIYRFIFFYIPIWLGILFNAYMYWRVVSGIRRITGGVPSEASTNLKKLCDRLSMYPLIMVICRIPPTINRIQNSISPQHPVFALFVLHKIFVSIQGFLNSIAYGFTPIVRACWAEEWERIKAACTTPAKMGTFKSATTPSLKENTTESLDAISVHKLQEVELT